MKPITKDMNKQNQGVGLVLEGGGLRSMFTHGILDVFLDNDIQFDCATGVSAGVLFGCNFKSRQRGKALRYNIKLVGNKEYMSWQSLWKTGDYVNERFSYHRLPYEIDPFDFKTYSDNPMPFYAVCTDIEKGEAIYQDISVGDDKCLQWMRASSSMPVFAKPVEIDGHMYLDGGIMDSIPLEFMQHKGYQRNVVIMTQPLGYRKKANHLYWPLRLMLRKYPKVATMMRDRHIMYNHELDYVTAQQAAGNAFVIYPDTRLNIGRLELQADKIRAVYEAGIKKGQEVLPKLKEFLGKND